MGVICKDSEDAKMLRNLSDQILDGVQEDNYEYVKIDKHEIKGILTLENVVEFILRMDIKDEKDEDRN